MSTAKNKKIGAVMVVGAGIAGIQAALDLANAGYYVYLIEKTSAIGGRMSQLDKTFPTNDCAMCIISPKLVDCGRHLNIKIITNAEVLSFSGYPGNFIVNIHQTPRYIDIEKCTACGDCTKECPVIISNEFDQGISQRKAIFKRYTQAYPNAYCITKLNQSPCQNACPANLNIQGYIQMAKIGKYEEALSIIMKELPLPGTIARICPHPCENECRRLKVDEPIAICNIKRFIADQINIANIKPPIVKFRPEKVAIIGAGPAGLSCAYHLALRNIKSTIFEALPIAGGTLAVGIPAYRLPRTILQKEIDYLLKLGIEIKLNTTVGINLSLNDLKNYGYQSIFLATGAQKSLKLAVPGENSQGVISALEYLKKKSLNLSVPSGKNIVVIGGGKVAIDTARAALRNGAINVTIVMLESYEEQISNSLEIIEVLEEKIKIIHRRGIMHINAKDGKVISLALKECIKIFDESGRFSPIFKENICQELTADLIITAIGQYVDLSFLDKNHKINLSTQGTILVDRITMATNIEGVFAGGDVVSGPGIAIKAIADGREAAISIEHYLNGNHLIDRHNKNSTEKNTRQENYNPIPLNIKSTSRAKIHRPIKKQTKNYDYDELKTGLMPDQLIAETERCLNCSVCCECYQCTTICKAQALNHKEQPKNLYLNVGSIILAPGFDLFDPLAGRFDTYAYTKHPNIVTAMEFERILSASGPYAGHLQRPSDGIKPQKIAWLQCVGSRNINHCDNAYCSTVCCMYAIKEAIIAKEHTDSFLDTVIFYIDIRTHGKDFEKYYERAKNEYKVRFIRSRVHTVHPLKNGNLCLEYSSENGQALSEIFNMVVLSVGLQTSKEAIMTAHRLGIDLTKYNFTKSSYFTPINTNQPGIFACGSFTGPKDIPQAVMEGSAAACISSLHLAECRGSLTKEVFYPPEKNINNQVPRIGVFICNCGINISGIIDVIELTKYTSSLLYVVYAEQNLFTCSQDTQTKIKIAIKEYKLNRIIVASCSPRTHETLFQETIREAGLNKYLFEMVNIRDQNSWVHQQEPIQATNKAKDLVRMAVAKAKYIEPLYESSINVSKNVLVIGGGVAGLNSALNLAIANYTVYLIEKTNVLGGHANLILNSWNGESIIHYVQQLIEKVKKNKNIILLLNSEVTNSKGFIGNFVTTIRNIENKKISIDHGVTILATGAQEASPTEYLYGKHPKIQTALEFNTALKHNYSLLTNLKSIAFIQCVGSREPGRLYCSRLCCVHSIKKALKIKEENKKIEIYILYRDIRTYGIYEDLYKKARELGILFIRYNIENKPIVIEKNNKLVITTYDHVINRLIKFEIDQLVLASAIIPNEVSNLAKIFKVPINIDGFFLEAHMKLRPVDFANDGLYLAGLAHFPKPINETIAQANAAVGRALTILNKNKINVGGIVAQVDTRKCSACLTCIRTCPYSIPKIIDGIAYIELALCYGCGSCVAECPGKAIQLQHFTDKQILSQEKAAFNIQ